MLEPRLDNRPCGGRYADIGVFRRFTLGNVSCTVFNAIGIPTEITDVLAAAQLCGGNSP